MRTHGIGRVGDLPLAGEEHQDVPVARGQQLVDGVDDRAGQIECVPSGRGGPANNVMGGFTGTAGHGATTRGITSSGSAMSCLVIAVVNHIVIGRLILARFVRTVRAVTDLDRIGATGHLDDRCAAEVPGELLRVDGGGGDDECEVGSARQQAREVAEQEVDVEAALVRLVENDRVVAQKVWVRSDLGEQDAVRHELDERARAGVVAEPDAVPDGAADDGLGLLGDAFGQGAGGDAPRLGVPDEPADAAAELQADLRELRGLSRAGLAGHHHDLMVTNGRRELLDAGGYRKERRVVDLRQRAAPELDAAFRASDAVGELGQFAAARSAVESAGPGQRAAQSMRVVDRHLRDASRQVGRGAGRGPGGVRLGTVPPGAFRPGGVRSGRVACRAVIALPVIIARRDRSTRHLSIHSGNTRHGSIVRHTGIIRRSRGFRPGTVSHIGSKDRESSGSGGRPADRCCGRKFHGASTAEPADLQPRHVRMSMMLVSIVGLGCPLWRAQIFLWLGLARMALSA